MRRLTQISLRIRSLFHRRAADGELDSELRFHIEQQIASNIAAGMPPTESRRQAMLEFGGVEELKEECRDMRKVNWLQDFVQDVRFGFRMLRKSPGFTAVAVLTLALGIGANTAIFSLVDSLFFRSSPVANAGQMTTLAYEKTGGDYDSAFSYPDFEDIRKQTSAVFSDVAASIDGHGLDGLSVGGKHESIWTSYVSGNFFPTMGLKPALGIFIEPKSDGSMESDPVFVLGYAYWKSRLAGDPNIVGKSVLINGHPVTVIGVAPKGFHSSSTFLDTQGYLPFGMAFVTADASKDFATSRESAGITIYGRLKPGVTLNSAESALHVVGQRLSSQYPTTDKWMSLLAYPLGPLSPYDDPSVPGIIMLVCTFFLILTALVLLLACLNVVNLLLTRASAREREMALRSAVGATRSRLVRLLLTESLLLAFSGGIGGVALERLGSYWLGSVNWNTTIPLVLDFQYDWRVFTYAFAAALLTGIVVGIAPALRATRGNLNDLLHESGRTATASRQRARSALVIAQVGGSLMLLIITGLFVRSLLEAERSNLGFDPNNVQNFTLDAHASGYNESQGRNFLQGLLPRVGSLPGVATASLAATVPMGYVGLEKELRIAGYQPPPGENPPSIGYDAVSSNYFDTMRIPIVRGREFLDSDTQSSPRVAVVNEAMAKKYWHGENPIGQRFIALNNPKNSVVVVGVAGNSKTVNSRRPIGPYMYLPLAQDYRSPVTLQLRTSLPLAAMSHEVVDMVQASAPTMPVLNIQTMTDALDTLPGLLLYQIGAGLAASLGFLGLSLAIIGVYGVVACAASQRTHEIGIRMALGAQRIDVLKMVICQGFWIVSAGIFFGVLAAFSVARLAGNFLSGVSPLDPLTYVGASIFLAVVALAACYIPARRATRVDPMVALRYE